MGVEVGDERGVGGRVGEPAVPADVVGQLAAEVVEEEPAGEPGEEVMGEGGEPVLGGELADRVVDLGHDPAMGARPLARVIQEKIKKNLAEELLFGDLRNGGSVYIDFDGKDLTFVTKADKARPRPSDDDETPDTKNLPAEIA